MTQDDTGETEKLWGIPAKSNMPDVKFSVSAIQCASTQGRGVRGGEGS